MLTRPSLGFGLGLRVDHYEAILADRPHVDWFEVLTENYLVPGGKPLHYLMRFRERYPLAMHGVSLSIGSTAPLNREYLAQVKALAQRPGHVKSRDQLMDAAYGETIYVDDRTIDSHIKRVRRKFREVDGEFEQIETLYGIGYRYRDS